MESARQRCKVVGAGNAGPGYTLKQILIGPGLIRAAILPAEDIASEATAGILLHQGELDFPVLTQRLVKLITEAGDPPELYNYRELFLIFYTFLMLCSGCFLKMRYNNLYK